MKKYVVLSSNYGNNDIANGARTRLSAWELIFSNWVDFYDLNDSSIKLDLRNKKLLIDYPGIKIWKIISLYIKYRKFKPKLFMQDSQSRYYYTQGIFNIKNKYFLPTVISLINLLRSFARESLARLIFSNIGFCSTIDSTFFINNGYPVELFLSNAILESNNISKINVIGIVANFDYQPNQVSLNTIFKNKLLIDKLFSYKIKIRLLGKSSTKFIHENINLNSKSLQIFDIQKSGPFDDIRDQIEGIDIFLSPSLYGAGVKNKINEVAKYNKITLAWEGCRYEYPYDPYKTIYFQSIEDLITILDIIHSDMISLNEMTSFKIQFIKFMESL